jgi:hypothetical protein
MPYLSPSSCFRMYFFCTSTESILNVSFLERPRLFAISVMDIGACRVANNSMISRPFSRAGALYIRLVFCVTLPEPSIPAGSRPPNRCAPDSATSRCRYAWSAISPHRLLCIIADGCLENILKFTYGYEKLRFPKPVYVGDTISTTVTIKSKSDDPKRADFGRVVEACDVRNQRGETVLYCEHILLVQKRPAAG